MWRSPLPIIFFCRLKLITTVTVVGLGINASSQSSMSAWRLCSVARNIDAGREKSRKKEKRFEYDIYTYACTCSRKQGRKAAGLTLIY
jgi:hypothetical protein